MVIGEVAKKFNLTADTLRYYEKMGLIPNITKTVGGIRDYSEKDCDWIGFVKCMRASGISVDSLAEYFKLYAEGDGTKSQRIALLIRERDALKQRLDEMQECYTRLCYKVENYNQITEIEKNLKE